MTLYDPDWVRSHYDEYADREWARWDKSPVQQVKLAVHLHYLREYVGREDRVLEIGAGPGRFTQELAGIARSIVVADISPVQLRLNRENAAEIGFADPVEDWIECDVCDLGPHFADGEFDAVVCYGGALSYVFDRRDDAAGELARVTRPGGRVLVSAMGLWGSAHEYLPAVLRLPPEVNRPILSSGDQAPGSEASAHYCHMYRSGEFRGVLEAAGLEVEVLSASNCISAGWGVELAGLRQRPGAWEHLIEMELEASRQPGCVDMGTHIIAVCHKPD